MAGFSIGHGSSDMSSIDPLLPRKQYHKKPILPLVLLLAFLALAFTCILPWPFSLPKTQLKQELSLEDEVVSSCISHTRFPEVCISSLLSSSLLKGTKHNVVGLGIASLATEEAMLAVHRLYSLFSTLKANVSEVDVRGKAILNVCKDVFDRSYDHLILALNDLGDLKYHGYLKHQFSKEKVNDIRTWLSASLAFHTTCTDELLTLDNESLSLLKSDAHHTAKLISNALAFVTSLYKAAGSKEFITDFSNWDFPLQHPRTLHEKSVRDSQTLFPAWLSDEDLALLQAITPTPNVTVAADGSGEYTKVQDAVNAAPQKSSKRYVIYIKEGVYDEQVNISKHATNLMFIGDGIGATIITGNKSVQQPGVTTFTSATVIVGGAGFLGRDITFRNTAGAVNHQAVALRVSADKTAFYKCSMEAYQDTLYAHSLRQFYRECDVYGTVDFIFGDSAAVFQNCRLLARVPLQGQKNTITAQGRKDPNSNTGLSFQSCTVDGTADLMDAISEYPTYLGRPWKNYSRTVFLKSYESSVVNPEGWLAWNGDFAALKTLFYGEYLCTGPGAAAANRVPWSTQITNASVADQFTVANFIDGTSWLPTTSFPYQPTL